MRLLLDTHAFLWFCGGDLTLSPAARRAIENGANEVFVSHATAWEVAIKINIQKLKLPAPFHTLFDGLLRRNRIEMLPASLAHYLELIQLPLHHRDPFDRLIIAQARCENLTIVTCDKDFPLYGHPILW